MFFSFVFLNGSFLESFKKSFDLRIAASFDVYFFLRLICSLKSLGIVSEVTRLIAPATKATALEITPVPKSNNGRDIKWSFMFLF